MIIRVGSKNPVKIQAVKEVFSKYFTNESLQFQGVSVDSGVSAQPKDLWEVAKGAENRARAAFEKCKYSVELESGLMFFPFPFSDYHDACICSIYDGLRFYYGVSSSFELPSSLVMHILNGSELSDAAVEAGFTSSSEGRLGEREGIIGILTNGLFDRKTQISQAIEAALPKLINPQFYTKDGPDGI